MTILANSIISDYLLARAGVAQLAEYKLPKLGVTGSIPVTRSTPSFTDVTGVDLLVHFFFEYGNNSMMNQETKAKIAELARTNCQIMGLELWGVEYFHGPGGKKSIVRVFIDSDQGVSIDQCAELSRNLSVVLDVEDIIPGTYTLEVSSPGLNRKFFNPLQMEGFTGQKVRISLKEALQGRKNFTGTLRGVDGKNIIVRSDSNEEWSFDWDEIDKANLAG